MEVNSKALRSVIKRVESALAELKKMADDPGVEMPEGGCLVCGSPATTRGLCDAHYQAARRKIREGTVTEEQLITARLMSPDRRGDRPRTSRFEQLIEERLPDTLELALEAHEEAVKLGEERKTARAKKAKQSKKGVDG